MTTGFSQGSAATDVRGGGSFNSNFSYISFLNLTVKENDEIWSNFAEVIVKIKVGHFWDMVFFILLIFWAIIGIYIIVIVIYRLCIEFIVVRLYLCGHSAQPAVRLSSSGCLSIVNNNLCKFNYSCTYHQKLYIPLQKTSLCLEYLTKGNEH